MNQNILAHIGNRTLLEPYIGSIGSNTRRYKETHTPLDGQSHLMRNTQTSASPEEGIATNSYPISAQYKVALHSSHGS